MRSPFGRLNEDVERFVCRHVLGLMPDPEAWPEPHDLRSLVVPKGMAKQIGHATGWVLDHEHVRAWLHQRTVIGAHAFRFVENAEYDCGWRLVDVAQRFLQAHDHARFDVLVIVPPPPVFAPVPALEWSAERLARRFSAAFRPDLLVASAPLADHPDLLRKPPVPIADLYSLERPASVFNRRILLVDWRWHKGRAITAITKLLQKAGAEVVCFAWLE